MVDDGADGTYGKGAGTVIAIPANFGLASNTMSTSDAEAPYFAAWMNRSLNSYGFLKFTVSASRIDAQYVAGNGTYSDQFAIVGTGASTPTSTPMQTPTNTPNWTPTPSPTPLQAPTATPTGSPTATPIETPTATPTATQTPVIGSQVYTFTSAADSYVLAARPTPISASR